MPLDEIGGAILGAIGRIIAWIFLQIIFEIVCFYIGRFFILAISLGQYEKIIKSENDGTIESIVGLILLVSLIIYITN